MCAKTIILLALTTFDTFLWLSWWRTIQLSTPCIICIRGNHKLLTRWKVLEVDTRKELHVRINEVWEDYLVCTQVEHNKTTKWIMNDNNSNRSNNHHTISMQNDYIIKTMQNSNAMPRKHKYRKELVTGTSFRKNYFIRIVINTKRSRAKFTQIIKCWMNRSIVNIVKCWVLLNCPSYYTFYTNAIDTTI